MVHLHLDDEEGETLKIVIESHLSELRMEIADTDSMDYRVELKNRKAILERIASLLVQPRTPV